MKAGGTFLPAAEWLPEYQLRWLRSDVVAGITLAAYAIPVPLAYAGLAGLPPQVGIYGYLLGGLGYALFGSSRHSPWGQLRHFGLEDVDLALLFRDSDRFSVDVQHARAGRMANQDNGTTITRGSADRRGT
jgi:Sulfate permease family